MSAPLTPREFAALMAPLGPWPAGRRIAVACSGGADSLALTLLAAGWGIPLALIVDHGLRATSAAEASDTHARLAVLGIAARVLTLRGLTRGPGLAARARAARYAALEAACVEAGLLDLLLGHHLRDQAETVLMRQRRHSGQAGLAGMAPVSETLAIRFVRPLLPVPPGRLRATLTQAGLPWVEDPSNADPASLRAALRAELSDPAGDGPVVSALAASATAAATARAKRDSETAALLARRVRLYPAGYAVLSPGDVPPTALAALIRMLTGAPYPPRGEALRALAANPRPATLAGAQFLPAGRLGPGLLCVREAAAMAPPVPATQGAVWDRRFRLATGAGLPGGTLLGAVGEDAARLRGHTHLPAAILRTLPALRHNTALVAVPHIGYGPPSFLACAIGCCPATPASGAGFGTWGDAEAQAGPHVGTEGAAAAGARTM